MLTFEECLAVCELTEDEIDAIAEHEHVPEMLAVEIGSYIVHGPDGEARIKRMILDDIRTAQERGNLAHAAHLKRTLRHFIEEHKAGLADE
jgi:hypothetical protein